MGKKQYLQSTLLLESWRSCIHTQTHPEPYLTPQLRTQMIKSHVSKNKCMHISVSCASIKKLTLLHIPYVHYRRVNQIHTQPSIVNTDQSFNPVF